MAIVVTEAGESRAGSSGENAWAELMYHVAGTDDDVAGRAAVVAVAPATYDGKTLQSVSMKAVWVDTGTSDGKWDAIARYGVHEPLATGESSFAFDTGGGTQHVTQAISTSGAYVAAGTAPDFKEAIGVSGNPGSMTVEGVDITIPVYSFSETHYIATASVTAAYKGHLFALTGTVNNAAFKGFALGECLFLNASGAKRGAADWEITFRFAGSPNLTNVVVGDITVASKLGWEYLWIRYADVEDGAAKAMVLQPAAAYVEKVYELGNFALLGIGT